MQNGTIKFCNITYIIKLMSKTFSYRLVMQLRNTTDISKLYNVYNIELLISYAIMEACRYYLLILG